MSKTEKAPNAEGRTFTTTELVEIGDRIHNCTTALVFTDKCVDDNQELYGVVCGKSKDITNLLYLMLKNDKNLEEMVSNAVLMVKSESIMNALNKMGGKKE